MDEVAESTPNSEDLWCVCVRVCACVNEVVCACVSTELLLVSISWACECELINHYALCIIMSVCVCVCVHELGCVYLCMSCGEINIMSYTHVCIFVLCM